MPIYYDDNFGHWDDIDDPNMLDFYEEVQRKSVIKKCIGCGRKVKIMPQYAYCNSCVTKIENGMDLY